ncbi:hypothetical protein TNCV_4271161 [Trichonephila clavipes]|nr:hypothetical protein TNCV_4271161 [Trichonephila clavipes]
MKNFKHVHKTDFEKRYIENSQFNIVSIEKERGFQLPLIEIHHYVTRSTATQLDIDGMERSPAGRSKFQLERQIP